MFHRLANSGGGNRTFANTCCVITAAVFLKPTLLKAAKSLRGVLQKFLSLGEEVCLGKAVTYPVTCG